MTPKPCYKSIRTIKSPFKLFIGGFLVIFGFFSINSYILAVDIDWTETQPVGAVDKTWLIIASDSDGSNLLAGANAGRLYISSNGGANWTETQPAGNNNKDWWKGASDGDGSNLIVGAIGRLYTTSNGGTNWTERQPAGNFDKSWMAIASDGDGSNLIAGVSGGRLYISIDSGANWTETRPAGDVNKSWVSAASDNDGSFLMVGAGGVGDIFYISSNGGTNWTQIATCGTKFQALASDSDGSNLLAASVGGRVWISINSGANWTETRPAGDVNKDWYGAASDSDGSFLLVGVANDRLYATDDGGANWTETQPAGDFNKNWYRLASDSDGSDLLAGVNGGRLYLGTTMGCSDYETPYTCQAANCCWYYSRYPEFNVCTDCPTECSGGSSYNCALCLTEETCEVYSPSCYWFEGECEYATAECGEGYEVIFCITQETCEANGGYWYDDFCWVEPKTILTSWEDYYDANGEQETPTAFVNALATTIGGFYEKVGGFLDTFGSSFNLNAAYQRGNDFGSAIPVARGYLSIINDFCGNLPVGEFFMFVLIFMLAVGVFRIVRNLIQLIKIF